MDTSKLNQEEDKFRRRDGRKAETNEKVSEYLNDDGLEDDLIDIKLDDHDEEEDNDLIVSDKDRKNQEWNARTDVQRKH
ncbi:MAG TPA: hypothetical protein VNJ01_13325 [Bacteriovoracaceae bacterium]|nr:hypothetical protein [Bacteriovoracaceae bacterium]